MYPKSVLVITIVFFGVAAAVNNEETLELAFVVKTCRNSTDLIETRIQTLAYAASWTVQRLNYLEAITPFNLSFHVYEFCNKSDFFEKVFYLHQNGNLLAIITDNKLGTNMIKFTESLDIKISTTVQIESFLMKATLEFMKALTWVENVTIFSPNEKILDEFFEFSEKEMVCVKYCFIYGTTCPSILNNTPFIFFGYKHHFDMLANQNFTEEFNGLFVPLDGSIPTNLPDKTFVILPPHQPPARRYIFEDKFLNVPQFFEISKPLVAFTKNLQSILTKNCLNSTDRTNCVKHQFTMKKSLLPTNDEILNYLKIQELKNSFTYDVYQTHSDQIEVTNNFFLPLIRIFEYNIFENNLTLVDQNFDLPNVNFTQEESEECISYYSKNFFKKQPIFDWLIFRSEAWVYAFLSLSLLGVLFCISILIFILTSIFKRDILEGNPLLTLALLLSIMLLFCSVLPFSLESNTKYDLCLFKSLSVTMSYALVFSLLLSRCILLATAAKEIGFMSHIAGSVQSFLCLFIFGVQAALNLQLIGKCNEIFNTFSFVYLLSYNTMLLLLLLCFTPLIFKTKRNYREGKYFAMAIILTALTWFLWLSLYVLLDDTWREPMLCFGLVATGAVYLGTVFIPRTYLMTLASARDKVTSTIPSLGTATSTMDIYRTSAQPVYDCVNVAAINAVSVARAGLAHQDYQCDNVVIYTPPPQRHHQQHYVNNNRNNQHHQQQQQQHETESFDFRCDSPNNIDEDKITRF